MSLNAVIMAGGEGTRLRPLTCDLPKPMAPILGKPVLSYSLQLLRRHGLREIGVSLLYLPDRITRAFGSGAQDGVRLHYAHEKEPIGTAGSVRLAACGRLAPAEPFVVLSGDGLTDCDLTSALRFHREKRALATLVLSRVRDPLSYGVVMTDADGRVLRFLEKPGWGEAYADTVNTGVYVLSPEVLSMIPEKGACDFGQDLFPRLVGEGKPVYAFVSDAYWCDVGDTAAYLRAQADLLEGRADLDAGPLVAQSARIDPSALLEGPVYIGAGAVIGPHAVLSGGCCVGAGARVGAHARLCRCALWEDARVMERAHLEGAVLCRGAQAGAGAQMMEDSALGDGAQLGARAVLEPGAKVWPGKRIDPCVRVRGCLVWGGAQRPEIREGRAHAMRPEDACVLAAAYRAALGAQALAVCHDGSGEGAALCSAAAGALLSQGTRTLLAGDAPPPVLRAALLAEGADGALRFSSGGAARLFASGGIAPARALERRAEALAARQDYAAPFSGGTGEAVPLSDAQALYIGGLSALVPRFSDSDAPRVLVCAASPAQAALAGRALRAAGLSCRAISVSAQEGQPLPSPGPGETGFLLDGSMESARAFDAHGMPDDAQQTLLRFLSLPPAERAWLCPLDAPAALDMLAARCGADTQRIGGGAAQYEAALLNHSPLQFRLHRDGLYALLTLCALMARRRVSLREVIGELPPVRRSTRRIPAPLPGRGKALRALSEAHPGSVLDGGLRMPLCGGYVTVASDSAEPELVVTAEAASSETAEEICGAIAARAAALLAGGS